MHTIRFTFDNEPDKNDIDIWNLIFYSICCRSSLFRRKIWEKQLSYIPLSTALKSEYLQLILNTFPILNNINHTYNLLEYEYLYESQNNFFISNIIKSTAYTQYQRIGPRRMKSGLKHSTLVINKAGIIFDDIHNLELSLMNTFGYPVNTNIYFSDSEHRTQDNITSISSRIHTDRQDTFIIHVKCTHSAYSTLSSTTFTSLKQMHA